jgi:dihydroxy-acid dehydratase
VLDLAKIVKTAVQSKGMLPWQYNTIGVSDAITMGGEGTLINLKATSRLLYSPIVGNRLHGSTLGMRFSLQSREIIADSIETVTCAQSHDACIALPGCDKNMPGVIMGFARHNRPSIMVYGGTIKGGYSETLRETINITKCYEAHGAYLYDVLKSEHDPSLTKEDIITDIEKTACPGPGACAGMYTANTMAASIEAMGLTLPGSSSTPAVEPAKARECAKAAEYIKVCMEKNILPRDLLTQKSFHNAMVLMMVLGGSTNGVLHLLAMAGTAEVNLTLDDFQDVSNKIPFLADLAPSGRYLMSDLYDVGGTPAVIKMLIAAGLMDGSIPTVTGKTLGENVEPYPSLAPNQVIIRPLSDPIKSTGHIEVLRGNLAPGGAVAKITGKEGVRFTGQAMVFNKEKSLSEALSAGAIPRTHSIVLVVRYEGPRGGPGMPEQLKASAALMGAKLSNVALITDGRYSGASHGFIVGHIVPEAANGGPIALVKDGDIITIDAEKNSINVDNVTEEEFAERRKAWTPPKPHVTRGTLAKYAALVGDASHGAMTDLF